VMYCAVEGREPRTIPVTNPKIRQTRLIGCRDNFLPPQNVKPVPNARSWYPSACSDSSQIAAGLASAAEIEQVGAASPPLNWWARSRRGRRSYQAKPAKHTSLHAQPEADAGGCGQRRGSAPTAPAGRGRTGRGHWWRRPKVAPLPSSRCGTDFELTGRLERWLVGATETWGTRHRCHRAQVRAASSSGLRLA